MEQSVSFESLLLYLKESILYYGPWNLDKYPINVL